MAYQSKSGFMVDWAAGIFREAGKDPIQDRDGVEAMATIAAFGKIQQFLAGYAESSGSTRSLEMLDVFDRGNLLPVLDSMYPAVVRSLAASSGLSRDVEVEAFRGQIETAVEKVFADCREEYLEGVRLGHF
jgi:hypothetical protein